MIYNGIFPSFLHRRIAELLVKKNRKKYGGFLKPTSKQMFVSDTFAGQEASLFEITICEWKEGT
jgi:hypothetical protein